MLKSFLKSFVYAFEGILASAHGRNFKVQCAFALLAIVLGIGFGIDAGAWLAIFVCIGCVLGGECFNTALESIVDLASPEYHDLAKRAKDCAAGAVLVMSFASVAVAAVVFVPKFVGLFS